jgi:hypothetical protein
MRLLDKIFGKKRNSVSRDIQNGGQDKDRDTEKNKPIPSKVLSIADIIKKNGLRPLGNKKRLVFVEGRGCLDYRAQFRDRESALRYYEEFVKYAERKPPPILIEVMAAYTPETIYPEKYAFILPEFDFYGGVPENCREWTKDYQKWANEAILNCNDILRQHSYSAGNSYEYVPTSISSKGSVIKWTIIPPRNFNLESSEARELLSDPPEMGFKEVKFAANESAVPEKPDPQGPWIGVLFEISKFEEAWYGRAATKQLLEIIGVQNLAGCVIHGGDMLPECKYWCNAIHVASQNQATLIEASVMKSKNDRLAQDQKPVISGQQVSVSTFPFQGFVSKEGVYVGN